MGVSGYSVEIPPETLLRLERALKRQWLRYRTELQRCQETLSERAVHESRVAARRLLAILELLEGFLSPGRIKKTRRCLKRHLDIFDDLRDAQVLLRAARPWQRGSPQARLFYQWLRAREGRFAKDAQARVRRLRPKAVSKLVRACRDELRTAWNSATHQTASRCLLRAVDRAFGRTDRRRARIDPRRTETIHRTRVAFKKFRYMVEALAAQVLPVRKEFLENLRQYQARMGEIQDAQILVGAVEKFLRKRNIASGPGRELREQVLTKRQTVIESYLEIMDQMQGFWPLPEAARRST
jgi:CHAD domain-containing protein